MIDATTPEGRAELRALIAAATPLPWTYHPEAYHAERVFGPHGKVCEIVGDSAEAEATGELIVAAANALPGALDEIERLTRELLVARGEADPLTLKVREAARGRIPLGGPDVQALEGALAMTERERDAAFRRGAEAQREAIRLAGCDGCASGRPLIGATDRHEGAHGYCISTVARTTPLVEPGAKEGA